MLTRRSTFPSCADRRGVALVLVLAFVVLLTGLLVAFFARVTNERTVANSSTNTDKADLLARSALDVIVGDFKQEIALGSAYPAGGTPGSGTPVGSGSTASVIYTPLTPANAVPVRSGTSDSLPNLIRRSVRPQAAASATPSNASPVNSATDPSANGRSVSITRWNSHYLLPRKTPGNTSTDSTPVSDFTAPDWVLVNRTGPQTATPPTVWDSTMSDPSASNQNYVLGRYAYSVYDEGGLLDANVAGYPSQTTTTQSGRKGRASFADLTQLKAADNSWSLTQTQIDNLIGWRTHASTQVGGAYPTYAFNTASANSYFSLVTGTKAGTTHEIPDPSNRYTLGGFLTVPPAIVNGQTDQGFTSRQQLIQISRSLGIAPDVLQYLGTFSRDLEQPSFAPSPNRPLIQSGQSSLGVFGTGSDAYTYDADGTDRSLSINPPFLSVRAKSTFVRNDGSTAVIGEPLVKQRFPLSRLSLVLYNSTAAHSQTDPIYKNFGIYRADSSQPWQYDHGSGAAKILRLSDVAAWVDPNTGKVGRDPDFFELIKAAVAVGSLGKGAALGYDGQDWSVTNTAANAQQLTDTFTDLQVLQIGANIMDQYDDDSLPTRIAFASNKEDLVVGIEDLPYLYRVRDRVVRATTGTGEILFLPMLWNPHAQNGTSSTAPTSFRFRVAELPNASNTLLVEYHGVKSPGQSSYPYPVTWSTSPAMTFNAGEPNYYGFREPTLLAEARKPTGTNLNGHTTGETSAAGVAPPPTPARTLVGIPAMIGGGTTFPWLCPGAAASLNWYADKCTFTTLPVVNCYLEYQDPNGNWVTYDQQVFQWNQSTQANEYTAPIWNINNQVPNVMAAFRTDPRTSRWGMQHTDYGNDMQPVPAGNSSYIYPSMRSTGSASYGGHKGLTQENGSGFVGAYSIYSGSNIPDRACWGFDPGFWTENSVRNCPSGGTVAPGTTIILPPAESPHYTRSADGVVRRVMGGYASDTASGGAEGQTVGLPMVTGNTQSRPIIMNRPFRSVAELGYVFRGTPWGNLNMSYPESGDAALLDVFCVNELQNTNSLVAGRVNLNTQQAPVLQALISGAITDDTATPAALAATQASAVAAQLINWKTNTSGPLANRSELVGRWSFAGTSAAATTQLQSDPNPDDYYTGFASEIGKVNGVKGLPAALISRLREASIRALADSTTTRIWNLLIDVVAQSGRYPVTNPNQSLTNFVVEGERRYWLHVAIDRSTGQVLDAQYEPVSE